MQANSMKTSVTAQLGPVDQKLISANPGLIF